MKYTDKSTILNEGAYLQKVFETVLEYGLEILGVNIMYLS